MENHTENYLIAGIFVIVVLQNLLKSGNKDMETINTSGIKYTK